MEHEQVYVKQGEVKISMWNSLQIETFMAIMEGSGTALKNDIEIETQILSFRSSRSYLHEISYVAPEFNLVVVIPGVCY